MSELKKDWMDLKEKVLEKEEKFHEDRIDHAREEIAKHQDQEKKDKNGLLKDLRKDEIDHDESVIEHQSVDLEKDQERLDNLEGKTPEQEEACEKALEFKKLADQAKEEQEIDEDLFETPAQPLK